MNLPLVVFYILSVITPARFENSPNGLGVFDSLSDCQFAGAKFEAAFAGSHSSCHAMYVKVDGQVIDVKFPKN